MSRKHPKRRMTGLHFAAVPVEVLQSDAYLTLPNFAKVALFALAAQYRGNNNAGLALTRKSALRLGVRSKEHLVAALRLLQEHGLALKTRQGGKRPLGPCLYGITWRPFDDLRPQSDVGPTLAPTHTWAHWRAPVTGLPADQREAKQRDCRRTPSGLPADQRSAVTGLPADQRPPFNGTAGSPPSRVRREGAAVHPCRSSKRANL